jgi:peptidoglycan/LPS O-acetylase OafA/YrhL
MHEHIAKAPPANPITMVTLTAAVVLFVVVFIATPRALGIRLSSAVIAAMAAPMIFELPFDLIVMARTYPPVPPDPVLYRTLFFAPLFLVELTTLSLLAVSPMVKLSRPAFFCLALMLLVFAVWALAGFGYPSAPIPIAMNVVSKILAFVTALSLCFPEWFTRWRRSQPDPGIEQAADASELQPQAA